MLEDTRVRPKRRRDRLDWFHRSIDYCRNGREFYRRHFNRTHAWKIHTRQRIGKRHARWRLLRKKSSKTVRCDKHTICCAHRENAVRIDFFEQDGKTCCRCGDPLWNLKGGKIVRHDDASPTPYSGHPLAAFPGGSFYERNVSDRRAFEFFQIVAHPLHDEGVNASTCPWVATRQWLENQQRLAHFNRPEDRTLQREIEAATPIGCHPIEDVFPSTIDFMSRASNDPIHILRFADAP